MNRVILLGRLGRDPELRQAASTPVLSFSLATSERKKQGETWVNHTEWHAVVIFGKRAEALAKILAKGSQVAVEGSLRTTSWEKDGQKRYKTEVVASDVHLAGGAGPAAAVRAPAQERTDASVFDDDDIPF